MMDDDALLRYSRHILLPQIDIAGQEKLLAARVVIIGVGGIGSPLAMYLAAAGIGCLVLIDDDVIDLANLSRQIGYRTQDVGDKKVHVLKKKLLDLNPTLEIIAHDVQCQGANFSEVFQHADIILDASDNFTTRFAINRQCIIARKPLLSAAAIGFEGHLMRLFPGQHACYRCLYDDSDETLGQRCTEQGVISPLVGIIGSLQALEAIKLITGLASRNRSELIVFKSLDAQWRRVALVRDTQCPDCG